MTSSFIAENIEDIAEIAMSTAVIAALPQVFLDANILQLLQIQGQQAQGTFRSGPFKYGNFGAVEALVRS